MKKICVFAGSSSGNNKNYSTISRKLGNLIAEYDYQLFYGAAKIGLMGEVANGCLEKNGNITGVIPEFLCQKEVKHTELSKIIITKTMHERKSIMYENASIFIALPGGIGTLEELTKVLIVNIDNYWDKLFKLFDDLVYSEFMKKFNLSNYVEVRSILDIEKEIKSI
jgi:uncharacterized protein (TIGR00730 family)